MTQAPEQQEISWWIIPLVWLCWGLLMPVVFWILNRKRSWHDWKRLGRATTLPPEHAEPQPRRVRDLEVGQWGYVNKHEVVLSKKGRRVFVSWNATLKDKPRRPDDLFAPLKVQRLKRGFLLVLRTGDEFSPGSLFWGDYAPVIELIQAQPQEPQNSSTRQL